jgi:hypothetical protein
VIDFVTGFLIAAPAFWLFTKVLAINLPGLTGTGWICDGHLEPAPAGLCHRRHADQPAVGLRRLRLGTAIGVLPGLGRR